MVSSKGNPWFLFGHFVVLVIGSMNQYFNKLYKWIPTIWKFTNYQLLAEIDFQFMVSVVTSEKNRISQIIQIQLNVLF